MISMRQGRQWSPHFIDEEPEAQYGCFFHGRKPRLAFESMVWTPTLSDSGEFLSLLSVHFVDVSHFLCIYLFPSGCPEKSEVEFSTLLKIA